MPLKLTNGLDLRPKYKNGNNDDYTLSNLYIPNEKNVIIDISVMNSCTSLYKSSFKRICIYLSFSYGLSMQDSEDIVQDAFVFVTCNRSKSDILATWVWYCKKRAVDYINHIKKFFELNFDIYCQNNEFGEDNWNTCNEEQKCWLPMSRNSFYLQIPNFEKY